MKQQASCGCCRNLHVDVNRKEVSFSTRIPTCTIIIVSFAYPQFLQPCIGPSSTYMRSKRSYLQRFVIHFCCAVRRNDGQSFSCVYPPCGERTDTQCSHRTRHAITILAVCSRDSRVVINFIAILINTISLLLLFLFLQKFCVRRRCRRA